MLKLLSPFVLLLATTVPAQDGPLRVGAEHFAKAQAVGVGRMLADFAWESIDGEQGTLSSLVADRKGAVILSRDVGCPASKRYGPRTARIAKAAAEQGFAVLFVNSNRSDEDAAIREEIAGYGLEGHYVHDTEGAIARQLALRTTTETFVVDPARTLVYRGAIDDQYGIGFQREAPDHEFLQDALAAVAAGAQPQIRATTAPGCKLDFGTVIPEPETITYHNRISRILQDNCVRCHRDGGIAPFSLDRYDRAASKASMMDWVIEERIMPPWFAEGEGGPWLNDASLTAEDEAALRGWIAADCPEGDAADAVRAPGYPEEWEIGEPDLILGLEEPVEVPAEGPIEYVYKWIQNPLDEDRWLQAVEIEAGNPEVVHHVLLFLEEPRQEGESRRDYGRRFDGGLFGYFAGMVPGQDTTVYPDGMGKKLPAKAWIKLQIHYTPNGMDTVDRTRIGFRFAEQAPAHEMVTSSAYNLRFRIPAYASAHKVTGRYTFKEDGVLFSFAPHMHLRGKAFDYELRLPDGTRQKLLSVPRYDFNWQLRYRLVEPIAVPAGTKIEATAWFDNSDSNLANPDPSVSVGFGEQSDEEMMIGYFEWYRRRPQ